MKYNVLTITKNAKPILSSPKNEDTKIQIIDEINNLNNKKLMNKNRTEENKNKIDYLKELNKLNIYLETENEKINDIKPEPLPMKIDQINESNYNSIIQKIFHNKLSQKFRNNNINHKSRNGEIINKNENKENFNKYSFFNNNNLNIKSHNRKNPFEEKNIKNYNSYTNIYNCNKNKNKEKLMFILKSLDLENLINVFNFHYVNFSDLFELNKEDLLEMDIPIGPRNRIMNFINEYKKYGKTYELNELKTFFKNKIRNVFSLNNINDNELNYMCSDKNRFNRNYMPYNSKKIKHNNNHYSFNNNNNSNSNSISIFNNYCEKKYRNERLKNYSNIIGNINVNDINNNHLKNNSTFLNRYNSFSNFYNYKKNQKDLNYESIQTRNIEDYSSLRNDKINQRRISCISPIM